MKKSVQGGIALGVFLLGTAFLYVVHVRPYLRRRRMLTTEAEVSQLIARRRDKAIANETTGAAS